MLNLRQIFDVPGAYKDFNEFIPLSLLNDIHGYSFAEPVSIIGNVSNRAGIVTLHFTVGFSLEIICDRCLKEFKRDYHFNFEHIIVKQINSDCDDYLVAENESINLAEIALSDLLLELPSKMLCKDDCKGLCTVCGADLNESECNCFKK